MTAIAMAPEGPRRGCGSDASALPSAVPDRAIAQAIHDRDFIRKCREQDKLLGIEWEGTKE